jgi:hypothetical protein
MLRLHATCKDRLLTAAVGLYLSDVLPTSYHSVFYTGVRANDCVAVWAFQKGAKRVIAIDNNWRTEYAKSKIERLETINYTTLGSGEVSQPKFTTWFLGALMSVLMPLVVSMPKGGRIS